MGREKQELPWVFFVFFGGRREEQEKRKARGNIVYDLRIIVSFISKVAL